MSVNSATFSRRAARYTLRARRERNRKLGVFALVLAATFGACALAGAGLALAAAVIVAATPADCTVTVSQAATDDCVARANGSPYTLVMVRNTVDQSREYVGASGLAFRTCDHLARDIWASDSAQVTVSDGSVLPRVDAYCVEANDLRDNVAR